MGKTISEIHGKLEGEYESLGSEKKKVSFAKPDKLVNNNLDINNKTKKPKKKVQFNLK